MDPRPPTVAAKAALSVTALNEQVRAALSPLREVRVQGEVSKPSYSGGHLYFDLKDAGAKVKVTVWRQSLGRISLQVREGMQVVVGGRVDVWVQGGTYSLNAVSIEQAGTGALWAALQQLKEKLQREGLFDPARKVDKPYLPKAVGIVTSPTGAALRDMLRILRDRFPVRVLLVPAKVQGDGAAESIAQGIELLDRSGLVDVIIAGRGGGSIEDLWAFNEERLVRAFAACRTPIISAVGHETDTLLTDHAADFRAPTPTAAAEMVVPRLADLREKLRGAETRSRVALKRHLVTERRVLAGLRARLGDGSEVTGARWLRLEDLQRQLQAAVSKRLGQLQKRNAEHRQRLHAAHPLRRLALQQRRLDGLRHRLQRQLETMLPRRREVLQRQVDLLRALSPTAALQRGYGIVRRLPAGTALQQAADVAPGDAVEVVLVDGRLDCRVERVALLEPAG